MPMHVYLKLIWITLKLQQIGFNPDLGIDKYFFYKAKQAGKEIIALETLYYQISLFDALSKKKSGIACFTSDKGT